MTLEEFKKMREKVNSGAEFQKKAIEYNSRRRSKQKLAENRSTIGKNFIKAGTAVGSTIGHYGFNIPRDLVKEGSRSDKVLASLKFPRTDYKTSSERILRDNIGAFAKNMGAGLSGSIVAAQGLKFLKTNIAPRVANTVIPIRKPVSPVVAK